MAVKDISIEPTDDINLLRIRTQEAINSVVRDVNVRQFTQSVSFNNNRITNVANPSSPKDAVNLETVDKKLAELNYRIVNRVRPTTPFRPRVQCHALTFGLVGTVTAGDDLTPHVECHIPELYQLEAFECWVNSKVATTGTSVYDVEYTTNSGTSWASIFNTLPTLGSGQTELNPPHTDFAANPMALQRGVTFRVNCDAAGGAEDVEVVVRFYRIRKPPTLDRRDDLE